MSTQKKQVILPKSGVSMEEGTIGQWLKNDNDFVKEDEPILEVETDKAVIEVEAPCDGYLKILAEEGEIREVGSIVALICDDVTENVESLKEEEVISHPEEEENEKDIVENIKQDIQQEQSFATPWAKKKLKDSGVGLEALQTIKGTGPNGRIVGRDVDEYLSRTRGHTTAVPHGEERIDKVDRTDKLDKIDKVDKETLLPSDDYLDIPLSSTRQVIARRMTESASTIPHFSLSLDVNMQDCINIRNQLNYHLKDEGKKVSFNDILIKCASKALEKHEIINSTFVDEKIRVYKNINFGLAVALDNGLVVPVVKGVQWKSLLEIATEALALVEKAKNNRLTPDEMSGSTITLSNLGMYGIDRFTPIINKPESCILAVGQIKEKPVCVDGEIVSLPIMTITASFDHRVVDGSQGAKFLDELKKSIENPFLLML